MYKLILYVLVLSNIYLFIQIYREKKRGRILQAFIGGIFESVQHNIYAIETHDNKEKANDEYNSHCREALLECVGAWLEEDFWHKPFRKWIANDKDLFYDEKYLNGGFNRLYLDLYEKELKQMIETDKH